MSRKHPQNGPSFGKASHKKQKAMTDAELAEYLEKKKIADAELIEKARRGRRFSAAVRATGGTIPLRGPGAKEFWALVGGESKSEKKS